MGEKKTAKTRPYLPDFCSVATLAYRLDCAESTVEQYVAQGLLPPGMKIGNLKRWRWSDVEAWLGIVVPQAANDNQVLEEDPYEKGLHHVSA